jgi:hypothetical protein
MHEYSIMPGAVFIDGMGVVECEEVAVGSGE